MSEWRWQQENAKLQLENLELSRALSFYADERSYKFGGYVVVRRVTKVELDGGKIARKALEGTM